MVEFDRDSARTADDATVDKPSQVDAVSVLSTGDSPGNSLTKPEDTDTPLETAEVTDDQEAITDLAREAWAPGSVQQKRADQTVLEGDFQIVDLDETKVAKTAVEETALAEGAQPQEPEQATNKEHRSETANNSQEKVSPEKYREALEQRIVPSDAPQVNEALRRMLETQTTTVELVDSMYRGDADPSNDKPLAELVSRLDVSKSNDYVGYLSPATTRAELALARIASGDAELVKRGEEGLVEAIKLRPELQFNPQFNAGIENAYKAMAQARREAGLPPLKEGLVDTASDAQQKEKGTNPYDLLRKANEVYQDNPEEAAKLFGDAIKAADGIDTDALSKERIDLFKKRLELTSRIVEGDDRGLTTTAFKAQRDELTGKEWQNYREHLSPATIRTNAAFAMLSTGDSAQMTTAKRYLSEAITMRPELEFSGDYQKGLRSAFENHYRNVDSGTEAEVASTPPKEASPDKPATPLYGPQDLAVDYDTLKPGRVEEIDNEKELEPYLSDKVTGPVLVTAVLLLAGRTLGPKIVQRIKSFAGRGAERSASGTPEVADTRQETKVEDKATESKTETGRESNPRTRQGSERPAQELTRDQALRGVEGTEQSKPERVSPELTRDQAARSVEGNPPSQSESSGRPERQVRTEVNLGEKARFETSATGERTFSGQESALAGLDARQRLTDVEMAEMKRERQTLEERLQKEGKLTESETKTLEALRHFEANKFDPKVHQEILSKVSGRPEGGFSKEAAGRLVAVSILTTALLAVYINSSEAEDGRPLRRARVK